MKMVVWTLRILVGLIGFMVMLAAAGYGYERFKARRRPLAPGRLVDIGGRNLHLLCAGSGGPTVVWEAGGGSSSIASRNIQTAISAFTRICAYDRAGYGWSDPVEHARSFDDLATDLEQLLDGAAVSGPYILVGESMGGLMVRRFVARNVGDVAGVVLLDAAEEEHTYQREDMLRQMQSSTRLTSWVARLGGVRALLKMFPSKFGLPHDLTQDQMRLLIDDLSRSTNFDAGAKEVSAYFSVDPAMKEAGGFGSLGAIPTVVVRHGQPFTGSQAFLEDGWTDSQQRLNRLSTNSELIVAQKSGHAISLAEPELVVRIVRDLVAKVRDAASIESDDDDTVRQ